MGGNVGPAPIPIYRDNVCSRCDQDLWEIAQAEARARAEAEAEARWQTRVREEALKAAEIEVDRRLPAVPRPGRYPVTPDLMNPDWGWFLGTALYGLAGAFVLSFVFSSIATGFVVSFAAAGVVLGVWLGQAALKRRSHTAAVKVYDERKARYDVYCRERARLIDERMREAGRV
jgi:hypothetical protein